MYDIFTFTDQSSVGLILSNIIILLFLLIQTGFINYHTNSTFLQVTIVNIASIVILEANIAVWFNTMVSSINVFDLQANTTIPDIAMSPTAFPHLLYNLNLEINYDLFRYHPDWNFVS